MTNQVEWKDDGVSITYPVGEKHIKGAIAYLLSENQKVTLESIEEALPDLLFSFGNDFYNNAWYQNHHDQVEELYQKIFPEDRDAVRFQGQVIKGVHRDYAMIAWIVCCLVGVAGAFLNFRYSIMAIFPLFLVAWVYGYFKTKKNPDFFKDFFKNFLKDKSPWLANKMLSVALLVTLSFVVPSKSFAVFGVGDIVTDPGAYSYYVEQIEVATQELEKMQEQIKKQTEMLSVAKDQYDEVMKMKNTLMGAYNYTLKTIAKVRKLQEEIEEDPLSAAVKYGNKYMISDGEDKAWVSAKDVTDFMFQDPRKKDKLTPLTEAQKEAIQRELNKQQIRQKMLRSAMDRAEKVQEELGDRYKEIGEMAEEAKAAETLKQSADVNNKINLEVLKALHDLTLLTAQLGEAQAAIEYNGADDDEVAEELKKELEETEKASKEYTPQKEYLDQQGINLENDSEDEMMKILNSVLKK